MGRGDCRATVHGITRAGHDLVTKPPPPPRRNGKFLLIKLIGLNNLKTSFYRLELLKRVSLNNKAHLSITTKQCGVLFIH